MKRRVVCLVAVGAVVALGACSGGGAHASKAKTAVKASTTRPKPPPIAPLTGLADPSGASRRRCAITVKIDNRSVSQPKYGVEQADIVYEEVVEAGYTRLAAIFNSHAPGKVGSVRSVRKTDQSLVTPLRGIFAYSGGAPYAIQSIETAPVVRLDETRAGSMMFRDHSRRRPFNLYAHVDQMYARCQDPAPPPFFTYRRPHAAVGGTPAASVRVGFLADFATTWSWDAASGGWKRFIFGSPEISAAGTQFAPKNVVVMTVPYVGGDPHHDNEGAEAELVGQGPLHVFTAGRVITGTWSRPDKAKPAQLLDAAGKVIPLTPGQTWVELPDTGYSLTVTP